MSAERVQVMSCGHFVAIPDHYCHRPESPNNLLIWVYAGRGFVETEGDRRTVGRGTLTTFRRGPAHTYGSDRDDPWSILWVHVDGPDADGWLTRVRNIGGTAAPLTGDDRLRSRWLELIATFRSPHPRDAKLAHHLLVGLLGLICHGLGAPGDGSRSQLNRIAAVQNYVQAHLAEPLTAADLADVANLSPAQLTRVMQAQLGCSPMAYVIDQRIAQASSLLRESTRPIKAIAADVGYDDPYYFSRLFRRRVGCSPARYREQPR